MLEVKIEFEGRVFEGRAKATGSAYLGFNAYQINL